ncbi:MAG: adol/keto oxidoreductase [Firmicutes bacterium]|nr:adol/keto oxidoreductase [Bacillota bacterium]
MQFRRLGNSGLKVSNLCLGTMAFGRWIDEDSSARVLDAALDAGVNFVDTADVYGKGMDNDTPDQKGESEAILGSLLGARRQRLVLATKVRGEMGRGPNEQGLSRGHIMAAVDASLRRLRTDYIDLYQCHSFDPNTPIEESLRALDDLVRQGKVRYIGCSNFAAWQIAKAHGISERLGLARFVSVQPQYSLLVRDVEGELLPFCRSEGVGVIPYSPMARGLLTGKYRKGEEPPAGTRAAAGEKRLHALMSDETFDRVERFRAACTEWGLAMPQVATAWVLANPAVTSAIVGASKPEQVADAAAAAELQLSAEQLQTLDQIFATPRG